MTSHRAAYKRGMKGRQSIKRGGGGCLFFFKNITHADHLSSSMTFLFYTDTLLVPQTLPVTNALPKVWCIGNKWL